MNKRVILVHGFASWGSGKLDIDRLAPFWESFGYEVVHKDYGFKIIVALGNNHWAEELAAITQPGDVVCAHSNGCLVAQRASLLGAPFSQMVFIAPALPVDFKIGEQVGHVHVWHSPYDEATLISKYVYRSWGAAGNFGYKGKDPRITNYDRSKYSTPSRLHLDVFTEPRLSYFGPLFVGHVEEWAANNKENKCAVN